MTFSIVIIFLAIFPSPKDRYISLYGKALVLFMYSLLIYFQVNRSIWAFKKFTSHSIYAKLNNNIKGVERFVIAL